MRIKSWARYFITTIIILFLVFGADKIFQAMDEYRSIFYDPQLLNFTIVAIFFYGGVGVFLGLDHFLSEQKKDGIWRINWPKLIIMGLPALYFSLAYIIYSDVFPYFGKIPGFLYTYMANISLPVMDVFPIILGHAIATSFYKNEKQLHG